MKIVSVNTGRAQPRQINGRRVLTAIAKLPQAGPVTSRPT